MTLFPLWTPAPKKIILDNLKSSRANKTTLLIAHRISTVERLDKIIFLDDGKIEAVGPHDELYTSCPKVPPHGGPAAAGR